MAVILRNFIGGTIKSKSSEVVFAVFVMLMLFAVAASEQPADDKRQSQNQTENEHHTRPKRRYYVCPPDFIRVANSCYYLSKHMATWQGAHFGCKNMQSNLATLEKGWEDRHLRNYLNKMELSPVERWIGGIYDWQKMTWTWGASGKKMGYHGFTRMNPNVTTEQLKWTCVIMDPSMAYKWSYRSCVLGKHFICQTRLQKVTKNGRKKLRQQWNTDKKLNQISVPESIAERQKSGESDEKHRINSNAIDYNNTTRFYSLAGPNVQTNELTAFAHRRNSSEAVARRERKRPRDPNRPRRRNRNNNKKVATANDNSLQNSTLAEGDKRKNRKRRNRDRMKRRRANRNNKVESITWKTYVMPPQISEFHPKAIVEVHDY